MKIIKPLGDGVGTAAGVAWPTFGIVFGTLGLSIGASTTAIILGSISGGLFLLVLLPITYWSYRNAKDEREKLTHQIRQEENRIFELLLGYLLSITKRCLFKREKTKICEMNSHLLIQDIKREMLNDPPLNGLIPFARDEQSNNLLYRLIGTLDCNADFTEADGLTINFKLDDSLTNDLKTICKQCDQFPLNPLSTAAKIKTSITGFTGGFGSLAGCTAGTLGLLGSIGVFAGLAAIPVAGWAILGAAIIFGLAVAGVCLSSAFEKNKKTQRLNHYKKINNELNNIIMRNNITLNAEMAANRKYRKEYYQAFGTRDQKMSQDQETNHVRRRSQSVYLTIWPPRRPCKMEVSNSPQKKKVNEVNLASIW